MSSGVSVRRTLTPPPPSSPVRAPSADTGGPLVRTNDFTWVSHHQTPEVKTENIDSDTDTEPFENDWDGNLSDEEIDLSNNDQKENLEIRSISGFYGVAAQKADSGAMPRTKSIGRELAPLPPKA